MNTPHPLGNTTSNPGASSAAAAPNRRARRQARRAARSSWLARRRPRLSRLLAWLLSAVLGSLGLAHAQINVNTLPQGARVVVGSAQVLQGSNSLLISQSTARVGLDWQSFSIGANALVEFQQPDRNSVALNRVLGNDASEIYGRLKANGQVFLVNPNGILFARGAKVDVGGLVASTLDLSQQDFSDGRYLFGNSVRGGRVTNQGELKASAGGYLALLGRDVDNQGSLQVDAGSVVLASGRAATVSISGNGLISAVVTPGEAGSVLNSGSIAADGGSVTLTAKSAEGLAASLVNNSGIVRANTLVERGGEIWITGDNVASTGTLQARAEGTGDGGKIMLLADMAKGTAQVAGTLDATAAQGQGGFVETSGQHVRVAEGTQVRTLGQAGRNGTWLIDPNDYTVAASGGDITGATLSTNLGSGNVSIATATQGTAGGNGDIFVNDTVTWGANTLTLIAERNISINSAMNGSGSAGLALQFGQATTAGTGANYTINAPVSLGANGSFSTKQGSSGNPINYTLITALAGLTAVDGNSTALAGNYALATSLNLTSVTFSPIGNETTTGISTSNSFGGRFEGLGQTITGLTHNPVGTVSSGGLFATTSGATISNLRLSGFSLDGGFATGTLVGQASNTTIRNVSATGTVQSAVNSYVGGLVGRTISGGSITGASAAVTVSSSNAGSYVGGLAGESAGSISNSSASGSVTGGVRTGGLVGSVLSGSIDTSSASGAVSTSVSGADVGGLLGYAASTGALSNSSASGNVSGASNSDTVGGLVGQFQMTGGISNVSAGAAGSSVSGGTFAGGVIGWTDNSSTTSFVTNSGSGVQFAYLGASVSGSFWVGGLVGQSTGTATFSGVNSTNTTVTVNRPSTSTGGAGGVAGYVAGAVSNSSSSNTVVASGTLGGTVYLGGLVGQAGGSTSYSISNSSASGNVTGNYTSGSGGGYAGGLIGQINVSANAVNVSGGSATGTVGGASTVGGLVGYADGSGSITGSSASGAVTGTNNNTGSVGGLVGEFRMSGGMSNVHAAGTVSTGYHVGGLAGYTNTTGTIGGGSVASTVTAASVSGGVNVGGVIGWAQGSGTITGFTTSMPVAGGAVTNPQAVGGIVGRTAGPVSNSSSSSNVSGNANTNVGGLVGWSEGGGVSGSSASGTVTQTGNNANAGGLVGYLNGTVGISNSSASGAVSSTGTDTNTGGLVGGFQGSGGSISGSSATGTVTGGQYVGGLVGYFTPAGAGAGNISNSFATGDVSTTRTGGDVGGLVGYAATPGALTNSYARGNVTAAAAADTVGGLVGQFQMTGGISKVSAGAAAAGSVPATTVSGGTYTGGVLGWTNNSSTTSFVHNAADTSVAQFEFLGASVTGTFWAGGLVGYSVGTAKFSGIRSNTTVSINRTSTGTGGAGGMAGYVAGAVSDSQATGAISATGTLGGTTYLGGLIGQAGGSATFTISNSSASGSVTGNYTNLSGGGYGGGLIGQVNVSSSNGISVSGSSASGNVSALSTAGGLIGYTDGTGSISSSSATGTVTGTNNNTGSVGGLVGEFRMTGALASGVAMSNVSASGTPSQGFHVGGLAGYTNTTGTIDGGSVAGRVAAASVSGGGNVGGVIGYAQGTGGITGWITSMPVSVGTATNPNTAGGVVGRSAGTVSNSSASGNVSAGINSWVGGLAGGLEGSAGVSNSSASGTVTQTGNNAAAGGLVGYVTGSAGISNSQASGAVSSTGTDTWAGGLVGGFQGTGGSISGSSATGSVTGGLYVGGLVGYFTPGGASAGNISGSFATGDVSTTRTGGDVGGLVGYAATAGALTNSYARGNVTAPAGADTVGGLVGQFQMTGGMSKVSAGAAAAGSVPATIVSGGTYTGGVIGWTSNASTTSFVHNAADTSVAQFEFLGASVTSSFWAGGLVGQSTGTATFSGIRSAASVTVDRPNTGTGSAGGMAGYVAGAVSDSRATGAVSATGAVGGTTYLGGLIGQAGGAATFTISNSNASGTVTGNHTSAVGGGYGGGLIGQVNVTSTNGISIVGSSATGSVSNVTTAGGLVGYTDGTGSISSSSASGNVTGTNNNAGSVGGLVGEFRMTGALASGLAMSGVSASGTVSTGYHVGGLAGFTNTTGTIGGGSVASTVTAPSVSGGVHVGGVIGYAQGSGTITGFTTSMPVTGASVTNPQAVGGVVGRSVGLVSNSSSSSNVSGNANTNVGGLVGWSEGGGIADSSATGTVSQTGNNASVGGLVGYVNGAGSVLRSTASGAVSSTGTDPNVGGLVGAYQGSGSISASTASGNVTGGESAGGLVGYFSTGTGISSSSASGNVSPSSTSPNAGGLVGYATGSGSLTNSSATGTVLSSATSGSLGGGVGRYSLTGSLSGLSAAGNVTGGGSAGAVIGYFNVGNVALSAGSLTAVLPSSGTRNVSASTWAGGLIGYSESTAAFSGLSFTGTVVATSNAGAAGGLIGRSNGPVSNSSSGGSVSGPGNLGGLVGQANGSGAFAGNTSSASVTNPGTSGYVGGLVGYFNSSGGMTGSSNVTTATGNVSGGNRVGGLVGYYISGGSLADVSASGTVAGDAYVGGLVGDFVSSGNMTNAKATGTVTARDVAGGLVGSFYNSGNGTQLQADGAVTSTAGYAGGLFGLFQYSGTLTDSVGRGNVTGFHHAGGVLGYAYSNGTMSNLAGRGNVQASSQNSTIYVGGLAGEVYYTNLTLSQASGRVSAVTSSQAFGGGLVGYYYNSNTGASLDNSSATGQVQIDAGTVYAGGLVGYLGYGAMAQVGASGNVTATDSRASGGSQYVGGLAGYAGGPLGITDATAQGNVSGNYMVGGLVGQFSQSGAVVNTSASGNVSGGYYSGGLIGYAPSVSVQTGIATGNVTPGANSGYAGGLIGQAGFSNGQSISDSRASGNVADGATYAGGLLGYLSDRNTTTLGPALSNSSASGSVAGTYAAGGLVGYWTFQSGSTANRATRSLSGSQANGNVVGGVYSGGAVGFFSAYGGIDSTSATGSVTARGSSNQTYYAGGLVGYFQNIDTLPTATTGQLRGSYATGAVSAVPASVSTFTSAYLGGLVGYNQGPTNSFANIVDSYATGAVTQASTTGRLRTGGLVGYSQASLANVYATGLVTANVPGSQSFAGGLVAEAASGTTAAASFWATDSTGRATSALGSGVTLADLKTASTFTGWNLSTTGGSTATWRLYEGLTTPLLRSFLTPLNLTLANINKVYDGTSSLGSGAITIGTTGVLHPERILVGSIPVDVGTYALSASNLYSVQNGYDLTLSGQANLVIDPRPLNFAGLVANKVYDGTRSATLLSSPQLGGLVAGEDLLFQPGSGFSALFDTKNVGSNKSVTLSGSFSLADGARGKASNYLAPSVMTSTAAITPATVTAGTFSAVDRAYDGTTTVQVVPSSGTVTGVIAGDQVSVDISGASSGTMADKNVGTAKAVTINGVALSGADAANYVVGGAGSATVNITPRLITVNGLQATDKVYNRSTSVSVSATNALLSGAIAGDSIQLVNTSLTGQTADKNVGNGKAVTVSGLGLRGLDAFNYTVQQGALSVNVMQRPLTVQLGTTSTTNRVYDGTTSASTQFLQTWLSGDNIVVSASAIGFADKNVAYNSSGNPIAKTITASGLAITGTDVANYSLQNTTATTSGVISPKALTVSGVTAVDRAYDGTRNVTVNVGSATVDVSAVIAGDVVAVNTPSSGSVTGQTADKNVGTAKAVAVPGFSLTGADAGNYSITGSGSGVTVNITPKPLTAVYTGVDKVYDGSTAANVIVTSSDIVSSDQVFFYADRSYCYGCWTFFGDRNVGTSKNISISFNGMYGTDAANYSLQNTTGTTTANITPRPVTLRFTAPSKVYDGTTNANVVLSTSNSGIFSVDQITSTQTAVFADNKNVGNGKPINVSNIVVSGTGAANYSFSNTTATTTGNLTAKPITVSGISGVDRAYDGTTTVGVVAGTVGSSGFVAGDTVSVTLPVGGLSSGTIANKNVGSNKPVTVTGLGLAGSDAANYAIDSAASGITVNITPAALTPTYVGVDRVYNGGTAAQVTSTTTGILAGDTVTFSQQAVYSGPGAKDAGTGKPISVTNISLGGASAANYSLASTTTTTTGSILPKPVNVTFVGGSRVYNGLADVTASVIGTSLQFVSGDSVGTSQTALFSGDGSVGSGKTVNITNISLTGAQAANYSLLNTTATTTANITPRPLAVSGITATNRVYDGTTTVAVNVTNAAVDTSTVVLGDDVQPVLPSGGISTGTMADRNAGNAKAVSITGITLTGAQASNYSLVGASGLSVNIAPKPVTVVYSAASKVYDGGADAVITGTSTDILSVDNGLVSIQAQGTFTTGKNVGTAKNVDVTGGFLSGSVRDNYLLLNTSGSTTADITPRPLTVSYTGGSRVYDGGVLAPVSASVSGRLTGDLVGVAQTAVFTGPTARDVGTGKAISVSGVFLTGSDAGNYSLGSIAGTPSGSITPKPITVSGLSSVSALDRVYDGTTQVTVSVPNGVTLAPVSTDIVTGDQVTITVPGSGLTTGTMADKNAGSGKLVSVTGLTLSGTDSGNYVIAGTAGITVNIAPLAIAASWAGVNRVYDGTVAATANGSSSGVLTGDSLLIRGSGVFTDNKNVGTAKPVNITAGSLSGADARNYSLNNPTGSTTADVVPRSLTPSYSGGTRVYDGSTSAPVSNTTGGLIAGDQVAFSETAIFTGSGARNVGSSKPIAVSNIALSGVDAPNYSLLATTASTSGAITPKPLTLLGLSGLTAQNRVYDGTRNVQITVNSSGSIAVDQADIVAGDVVDVSPLSGSSTTGTVANKNVGAAKPVTVTGLTLTGADAGNYRIAATQGLAVTITPLDLTATWAAASRVYDGTTVASISGSSSAVIGGDNVVFGATGAFGDKNAGTGKAVTISSGRLTGADAGNYTLLNTSGSTTADITPRTVTATYVGGTRVYDGTLVAPVSGTLGNLVSGDTVGLTETAVFTGDKNVGVGKAVSISGIGLTGTDAINYSLNTTSASTVGSITPRPLRLTGLTGVTADSREYDGTTSVVVHVASTGTVTANPADLIAGDVVTVVSPPTGTTTGTVASKNVGAAKPVAVTGLGLTGADAGNYSVTGTSGVTVDITPRHLTASYSGVDRVYDGTAAATVAATSSGIVAGDALSITANGVFADGKNAGTAKPITVTAGALVGADAGNYLLDNPTGTASANVTPKLLTAGYVGGTRVYDGTNQAPVTRTLSGIISSDSVVLSETAVFAGGASAKNVGAGKLVQVSGISLSGTDAANYSLVSTTASTTGTITQRPLTVSGLSGITAVDRVYDGTTSVALNVPGTLGSASGDALAGDNVQVVISGGGIGAGTMLNKNAGQAKAVVLSGLSLTGTDAGNYFVAGTTGLTVNIAPKALNPVFSAASKVYDGTAAASVLGGSADILFGDSVSVAGTGLFTGNGAKNVGTGKSVSITGVTLSGADAGNYALTSTTGSTTGDITPRSLTAGYTGGSKVYDGTDSAVVTLSLNGLVSGDAVTVTESAIFTGSGAKNVGTGKAISVSGITLAGADAANYSLLSASASTTGSITPRPLTVSGISGITAQDRMYDGTTAVAVNLPSSISGLSAAVIPGDNVTVTVSSGGLTGGVLLDKNVGTAKPVVLQGLALTGPDAGNYTIGGTLGLTVNITPRPLAIAGVTAVDRVYDATTTVAINTTGGSLSGAIAGDDVRLPTTGVSGSVADKNVGNGKAVTVSGLTLAGADIGNYTVSGGTGLTVNITPRTLNVTAAAANKVYDGTTGASVTLSDDRLAGDSLSVASSAAFASRQAGTGMTVAISNLALSGTDAGNYQLAGATLQAAADITPRAISVTADDASKVYGNAFAPSGTGFTVGGAGLVVGETIGSVTLSSAGAAASAAVTGSPYALTPSAATGGSFDPANYALTYRSGLLTITPRPVTVSVGGQQLTAGVDDTGRPITWPSSFSVSTSDNGLVGGDRLAQVGVAVVGQTGTTARVGQYELRPSGGVFASGSATNYTLSYQSGALLVLPQATGQVLAVQLDPLELERAERELERLAGSQARQRIVELLARLRAGPDGGRAELSPADLALFLANEERRFTPRELLNLPLFSFDPELRRQMQQPTETTTP